MPLNPRDYDPDELRSAAGEDVSEGELGDLRERLAERDRSATSASRLRSNHLKELLLLKGGADVEDLRRPYLDSLPTTYAARVTLFEWLDFLLRRGGVKRTLEALEYYVEVGWISESVGNNLRDHVRAFDPLPAGTETEPMKMEDHVLSLVYVARLASMD